MQYFSATIIAGLAFALLFFFVGNSPETLASVSRETASNPARASVSVKHGVSHDGQLVISRVSIAPTLPPRLKSPNHSRTLRAFMAPNRGGVFSLYIESARPHEYYSVKGGFILRPDYATLTWADGSILSFYANAPDGMLMHYFVDAHNLTLTEESLPPEIQPLEVKPEVGNML